ncbi:hypothetical protein [Thalassospira marina]|uniref:Uncharacterized protein n=1 Tax=Thalassospira marina TaxID=2048283 RepID=A0A2N3KTH3_9PROT|nr:hypothetical protein [Thalassospira marina]AUG55731.1 hypothetical protein CSC3H3_23065 [Thalassospira marina]PKR53874.1 hypothetical protein COO20_12775 [Thalassospira marina]
MTNFEIMQLAYQLRGQGDDRPLADIVASVKADMAVFEPAAPGPGDVVGGRVDQFPDGRKVTTEILGDGTEKVIKTEMIDLPKPEPEAAPNE